MNRPLSCPDGHPVTTGNQHVASSTAPLAGLRVIDCGVGMAGALVAKFLAEAGAEVTRFEPPQGDPFYAVYPAYRYWRACLPAVLPYAEDQVRAGLAGADICIVGGEDIPGFTTCHSVPKTANDRLITLDIRASLHDREPLAGCDILVQARSGLVFEAYPDRAAVLGFVPSAYGAALHGLISVCAALIQRERDGRGQQVTAGLLEGVLAWSAGVAGTAENETPSFAFRAPRGSRPLVFPTRDGRHVHVVMGSAGSKFRLYTALGINDGTIAAGDAGMPNPDDGPDRYFGDVECLAPYFAARDASEIVEALKQTGVVCEHVRAPGDCWRDLQVRENAVIATLAAPAAELIGHPLSVVASPGGPARPPPSVPGGPLAGIRVVDFGAFVAGPLVAAGLAELGADVIKVEPPRGDPLRVLYKFYAAANRGKRTIAIEMKSAKGLALAHTLARNADVVCSNFRNGVAERLGIDAQSLFAAHPDKIVAINPGFGVTGPQANDPAFDPCMQANCGFEVRAGGHGNSPAFNPMMMIDICGGLLGQVGTLMALYRRALDGSGATVTVPLLNAALFMMSDIVRTPGGTLLGPQTLLADQTGYTVSEKLYRTLDGWIAISARTEPAAYAFATAFGIGSAASKPSTDWGDAELHAFTLAIRGQNSDAALACLAAAGVPAEKCRETGISDYIGDDANVDAGRVYETARRGLGRTRGLARLFNMSAAPHIASGRLGELGQDGRAIMAATGLGPAAIADCLSERAVIAA